MPAQAAARPIPWGMLGTLSKIVGFALLFVGVLVVVAFGTYGGGCVTSMGSCTANSYGQLLNSILAAKILVTLGLGGLGAGAGIKLHWGARPAAGEDTAAWVSERRFNGLLFFLVILLFVWLMATVNTAPPMIIPP